MIKNIYFDLDETLIHSEVYPYPQAVHEFEIYPYGKYHVAVRNKIHDAIGFARDMVGSDNVFILTVSISLYATEINNLCKLGFKDQNILTRSVLETGDRHEKADHSNLLIDNLPIRDNFKKLKFIGIENNHERYLEVDDFWGVNFPNDKFLSQIQKKINEINSRASK